MRQEAFYILISEEKEELKRRTEAAEYFTKFVSELSMKADTSHKEEIKNYVIEKLKSGVK